jgi:hypothetical protein
MGFFSSYLMARAVVRSFNAVNDFVDTHPSKTPVRDTFLGMSLFIVPMVIFTVCLWLKTSILFPFILLGIFFYVWYKLSGGIGPRN